MREADDWLEAKHKTDLNHMSKRCYLDPSHDVPICCEDSENGSKRPYEAQSDVCRCPLACNEAYGLDSQIMLCAKPRESQFSVAD